MKYYLFLTSIGASVYYYRQSSKMFFGLLRSFNFVERCSSRLLLAILVFFGVVDAKNCVNVALSHRTGPGEGLPRAGGSTGGTGFSSSRP
jgi:hypothetical protein